jgi:hypothetical protein
MIKVRAGSKKFHGGRLMGLRAEVSDALPFGQNKR